MACLRPCIARAATFPGAVGIAIVVVLCSVMGARPGADPWSEDCSPPDLLDAIVETEPLGRASSRGMAPKSSAPTPYPAAT